MIRHHLFGAAHIDRIGKVFGHVEMGQSNPGSMRETTGGAAFNAASSLAALDAQVALSCILGNDESAERVRHSAQRRGITLHELIHGSLHPTATYTALLDSKGKVQLALADMQIYLDVDLSGVEVSPEDWVTLDANFPPAAINKLAKLPAAHRSAMTVSAAKASRLSRCLHQFDVLFTNRAEAAALTDAPEAAPVPELADLLAERGCRRAVISDGADDVTVLDEGRVLQIEVQPCRVVDVLGAGDALAAGSLAALAKGASLPDAVLTGIQAAQAVLGGIGPYCRDLSAQIGEAR